MDTKLNFASDYTRAAHPAILSRLVEIAGLSMPGYGTDPICESAKNKTHVIARMPKSSSLPAVHR